MSSAGMKVGGAQTVCSGVGLGDKKRCKTDPCVLPPVLCVLR